MKKSSFIAGCIILMLLIACAKTGHIHLPGHGNVERQNLKESVVNHVTPTLANGETVEFASNYGNDYYKENGDVRFSTNVVYYVITANGSKEKHTAYVVFNEDRDKIYDWKEI